MKKSNENSNKGYVNKTNNFKYYEINNYYSNINNHTPSNLTKKLIYFDYNKSVDLLNHNNIREVEIIKRKDKKDKIDNNNLKNQHSTKYLINNENSKELSTLNNNKKYKKIENTNNSINSNKKINMKLNFPKTSKFSNDDYSDTFHRSIDINIDNDIHRSLNNYNSENNESNYSRYYSNKNDLKNKIINNKSINDVNTSKNDLKRSFSESKEEKSYLTMYFRNKSNDGLLNREKSKNSNLLKNSEISKISIDSHSNNESRLNYEDKYKKNDIHLFTNETNLKSNRISYNDQCTKIDKQILKTNEILGENEFNDIIYANYINQNRYNNKHVKDQTKNSNSIITESNKGDKFSNNNEYLRLNNKSLNNLNNNVDKSFGYLNRRHVEASERLKKIKEEKEINEKNCVKSIPQINNNSKLLSQKSCSGDVFTRLNNQQRKKLESIKRIENQLEESYKPIINSRSKLINRTIKDLYDWNKKKEDKRSKSAIRASIKENIKKENYLYDNVTEINKKESIINDIESKDNGGNTNLIFNRNSSRIREKEKNIRNERKNTNKQFDNIDNIDRSSNISQDIKIKISKKLVKGNKDLNNHKSKSKTNKKLFDHKNVKLDLHKIKLISSSNLNANTNINSLAFDINTDNKNFVKNDDLNHSITNTLMNVDNKTHIHMESNSDKKMLKNKVEFSIDKPIEININNHINNKNKDSDAMDVYFNFNNLNNKNSRSNNMSNMNINIIPTINSLGNFDIDDDRIIDYEFNNHNLIDNDNYNDNEMIHPLNSDINYNSEVIQFNQGKLNLPKPASLNDLIKENDNFKYFSNNNNNAINKDNMYIGSNMYKNPNINANNNHNPNIEYNTYNNNNSYNSLNQYKNLNKINSNSLSSQIHKNNYNKKEYNSYFTTNNLNNITEKNSLDEESYNKNDFFTEKSNNMYNHEHTYEYKNERENNSEEEIDNYLIKNYGEIVDKSINNRDIDLNNLNFNNNNKNCNYKSEVNNNNNMILRINNDFKSLNTNTSSNFSYINKVRELNKNKDDCYKVNNYNTIDSKNNNSNISHNSHNLNVNNNEIKDYKKALTQNNNNLIYKSGNTKNDYNFNEYKINNTNNNLNKTYNQNICQEIHSNFPENANKVKSTNLNYNMASGIAFKENINSNSNSNIIKNNYNESENRYKNEVKNVSMNTNNLIKDLSPNTNINIKSKLNSNYGHKKKNSDDRISNSNKNNNSHSQDSLKKVHNTTTNNKYPNNSRIENENLEKIQLNPTIIQESINVREQLSLFYKNKKNSNI